MMLAMETGLSRTTVNNWFINARRRYVKPLMQGRLVLQSGVFKTVSGDSVANKPSLFIRWRITKFTFRAYIVQFNGDSNSFKSS